MTFAAARGRTLAGDFNPRRLRLLRDWLGQTQIQLAAKIGVAPRSVSRWENGQASPDREDMARLALATGFPAAFFLAPPGYVEWDHQQGLFRKLADAPSRGRRRARALLQFAGLVVDHLEEYVRFPEVTVPYTPIGQEALRADIELAASDVRDELEIEPGPIANLVALVESAGVVVVCASVGVGVDAFSISGVGHPVMVINELRGGAARRRWTVAHEFGHLVMHPGADPDDRHLERQADQFAAALLLPAEDIEDELPSRWDRDAFVALSRVWGVSVVALVRRAKDLGRMSPSQYQRAMRYVSAAGWRSAEAVPLGPPERPTLLARAVSAGVERGFDADRLAEICKLPGSVVELLVAGANGQPHQASSASD